LTATRTPASIRAMNSKLRDLGFVLALEWSHRGLNTWHWRKTVDEPSIQDGDRRIDVMIRRRDGTFGRCDASHSISTIDGYLTSTAVTFFDPEIDAMVAAIDIEATRRDNSVLRHRDRVLRSAQDLFDACKALIAYPPVQPYLETWPYRDIARVVAQVEAR